MQWVSSPDRGKPVHCAASLKGWPLNHYSEVSVRSAGGGYSVRVGAGVRELIAPAVARAAPSRRCALISDHNVEARWGSEVIASLRDGGIDVVGISFAPGEASKTRETWAALTDSLLGAGLGRDACVVSLGGGVVGDVAGFVAATYLRGVPFIQVPTTTLAMIDASVGGKTGVDHPTGKNLVGAFHAPEVVLADPEFLSTLGAGTRAEGYAEAVKHGVIVDAPYAAWLSRTAEPLVRGAAEAVKRAVVRSVEIKGEVVSGDEFEAGRRQILNLGHTVGHALELDSAYSLPHGHAVAVGMVAEARIGEALGVTAKGTTREIRSLVRAFGLPDDNPALRRPRRIAELMVRDKKTRSGVVHMVRLEELGRTGVGNEVTTPVATTELVRIMKGWAQ
ncbi:MAG: 3-dehydroquinate synthase [Gemmatimonadetes bacterium]|nr:3-dehydroquinate synthase [Gemmatimonadota bacterium]